MMPKFNLSQLFIQSWSQLSKLGENKIVKNTYIFFFLVPFIISILDKFNLGRLIQAIPFSWQIFFYSSVLFTLGSIIYNLFAPNIIKENKSFANFISERKSEDHLYAYAEEIGIDFNEYNEAIEKLFGTKDLPANYFNELLSKNPKKIEQFSIINKQKERVNWQYITTVPSKTIDYTDIDYKRYLEDKREKGASHIVEKFFWDLYNYADNYTIIPRIICTICFSIGSVLIVIVSIKTIIFTINFTLS